GEVIGFTLTLELAENARDVSGSISAMGFLGEVTGTWNFAARQLQLAGTIDMGPTITMDVTVDGNSFSGSANAGGAPYDVTATREVTEQVNTANPAADGDGNGDGEETDADASDAKEKDEAEEEVPKEFDPKRWHDAIRFNIEPVVADSEHNDRQPSPSPNGEHLAFRRGNGNLMVHDFATDETRLLVPGWDASIGWRWRPDSKLIAYDQNDLNFNSDVWIVPADGSADPVNITRHPDSDSSPRWSADGKVLTFTSEREDESWNLYRVYLDKDLEALSPKELTAYYDEAVKDARKRSPIEVKMPDKEDEDEGEGEEKADGQGEDAAEGDTESKSGSTSEKEDPATDFDDAYLRLSMVVRDSVAGWQNELTPGGDRLIFSSGGLQSVKWDGSDRKSLGGGSIQHLNLTGDKLVAVSGGRAGVVNPNGGSMNYYDIDYTLRIDLNEESSQKFLEAARVVGERFYHPTMKGLDWKALSERYHDLARRARTSTEFNAIANRLLGELNGSHLGIRTPDDTVSDIRQSHGRLGTRHHRVDKGFEVTEIIPESPAAKGAMALKVGDIITAVDFESLGRTDTIEARLEGKVNEEVVLTIHRTLEEGEDPVELNLFITPISSGRERALLYDHWVLENKRLVDEWSNGRLGYVHVQGMNQPSLNVFERDLYAAADGKDGLLVDVRNNGGGWTADRLLASITVQPHAYTIPRDADPSMTGYYPQDRLFIQRYTLPMNMLANEKSFSNAEIVSHAFKTLNRGNLVGQQTYGGVISTGGTRLLDGTFVRIPFRGWFLPDGTDMENNGAMPDVLVPQTPESEASNDDIQLRAAVEDLLKRLD
ncbi:MAG: S41 family peptidase, partial [Planctomycetota bacterium]